MLIGIMAQRRSKYLNMRTKDSPGVPYEPRRITMMADRRRRIKNRTLLTMFSSSSSWPNLLPAYLELSDSLVSGPM